MTKNARKKCISSFEMSQKRRCMHKGLVLDSVGSEAHENAEIQQNTPSFALLEFGNRDSQALLCNSKLFDELFTLMNDPDLNIDQEREVQRRIVSNASEASAGIANAGALCYFEGPIRKISNIEMDNSMPVPPPRCFQRSKLWKTCFLPCNKKN
jgi:hypothetical protein